MAKKIDNALHDLVKALEKHAAVVSDKKSGKSKVETAAGKVRAAGVRYGRAVAARTGTNSPFAEIADPRLDEPTMDSLKAERDAAKGKRAAEGKSGTTA